MFTTNIVNLQILTSLQNNLTTFTWQKQQLTNLLNSQFVLFTHVSDIVLHHTSVLYVKTTQNAANKLSQHSQISKHTGHSKSSTSSFRTLLI